eukprot:9492592-Pyramimonas_sp.AAC.1
MSLSCRRAFGATPVWPTAVRPLELSAALRTRSTPILGSSPQSAKSGGFTKAGSSRQAQTSAQSWSL